MAVLTKRKQAAGRAARGRIEKPLERVSPERILKLASERGIDGPPVDLEELTRSFGIELKRHALPEDISGHLKLDDGKWRITLNSLHHPNRQRFTLAHELAHFLLHTDSEEQFVDKQLFRDESMSPMEQEANRFAAELLMPERNFKDYVKCESKEIKRIAERFAVSPMAVRMRARELGFSGHGL